MLEEGDVKALMKRPTVKFRETANGRENQCYGKQTGHNPSLHPSCAMRDL